MLTLVGSAAPGGVSRGSLAELMEGWRGRWPSLHQPSSEACLTTLHARELLLDSLLRKMQPALDGKTPFQVS